MKYELPTGFERTLQQFKAARIRVAEDYERGVRSEGTLSCRKGCHHCCHYPVLVGLMEALVIYRGIVQQRLWTSTLKKRFEEVSDQVRGLNIEIWVLSRIRCPLLTEEGTCLTYKSRPFSCRTVFSKSDPRFCDAAHSGGMPEVLPRKEALEEIREIESALMRKHQLGRVLLPLPSAVLLAEKLDKGEADFATVGVLIWKDYIQQW